MPCNTSDGQGSAHAVASDAQREVEALQIRVAQLEGAFCGLLTLLKQEQVDLPANAPQALREWWNTHQRHPGHEG